MTDKRLTPSNVPISSILGLLFFLLIVIWTSTPLSEASYDSTLAIRSTDNSFRSKPIPTPIQAAKKNVWKDLSEEDVYSVTQWLLSQRNLNLTDPETAGPWSNSM